MADGSRPLRVLFVEDSEDDVAIIVRELRRSGFAPEWQRVDDLAALDAALDAPWDVILCDYTIPGFGAMAALARVSGRGLDVPFIIVSGTIGEEAAVEAMRLGVHDFVLKDRLARLIPAIDREIKDAANRADLRRAEAALARNEKLRALGQMAAGIAHDLKNLLNPLGLQLELLERALRKASVDRPDAVATMRATIQRGVDTIDRLRTFSRIDPEPIAARVDVAAAAREAIALVEPRRAQQPGIVIADAVADTGAVAGRSTEVIGAIVNLLVNAADACGDRGTITVRTGIDRDGAWVEVADDGPGMAPEIEARVFEPFFTTKGELGTGLGLANVFATMRRHGGDVAVETAVGRGTRFTLRFPR
jgi:signal transduction histidine kinase